MTVKLYVAIVYNPNGSLCENHSHTCWVSAKKKEVIESAIKWKLKWEANGQYGPYDIVIGTITEKAVFPLPVNYTIERL